MRILVAEDNHDIRNLMVDILSSAHHQVETAENGAAALAKYADFNPDIVTLDLSMPVMDGYETLMRIMKLDNNASVIMVTAVENQELIDQCFHGGAIAYITKPFTANQLVKSIAIARNAASSDRKMVTVFSNAIVGMEDAIKKMCHITDSNILLTEVELVRSQQQQPLQTVYSDLSKIRVVPVNSTNISLPQGENRHSSNEVGFVTELTGQHTGSIISFTRREFLSSILDSSKRNDDLALDLFNVINNKILTGIVNAARINLKPSVPRLYDRQKDGQVAEDRRSVAKARYEVEIEGTTEQIEIHLILHTGQLFAD